MKSTLSDIERLDVDKFQLPSKVQYQSGSSIQTAALGRELAGLKASGLELLFASAMKSQLLDRLASLPERPYSFGRLLICDPGSYEALLKFQRIIGRKQIVYEPPHSVSAVLRLDDLAELMDRTNKPLMTTKPGRAHPHYNYSLIREVLPFVKMADLVILHTSGFSQPRLEVLQALAHYARSTMSLDLRPIQEHSGYLHPMHHNMSFLVANNQDSQTDQIKPSLALVSSLAQRLGQLSERLSLRLQTITYRAGDPNGFTKIFTQIVASTWKPLAADQPNRSARVLVVDRLHDLQGFLYHSQLYGPFVEQEMEQSAGDRPTLDLIDELDHRLQLQGLTDVLGSIIARTVDLSTTPTTITSRAIHRHMDNVRTIYQHLNDGYLLILRLESSLLETMNQLRPLSGPLGQQQQDQLADRLIRIMAAFRQLTKIAGKSIRPADLVRVACIWLDVVNVFVYIHSRAANNEPMGVLTGACKILIGLKSSSLFGKDFRSALIDKNLRLERADKEGQTSEPSAASEPSARGVDTDNNSEWSIQNVDSLMSVLEAFDAASVASCGQRATMTIQETIKSFMGNQLDWRAYPTVSLSTSSVKSHSSRSPLVDTDRLQSTSTGAQVLVVFLGSITYDEVSRIKLLESTRRRRNQTARAKGTVAASPADILLLACALRRPEHFLRSL